MPYAIFSIYAPFARRNDWASRRSAVTQQPRRPGALEDDDAGQAADDWKGQSVPSHAATAPKPANNLEFARRSRDALAPPNSATHRFARFSARTTGTFHLVQSPSDVMDSHSRLLSHIATDQRSSRLRGTRRALHTLRRTLREAGVKVGERNMSFGEDDNPDHPKVSRRRGQCT